MPHNPHKPACASPTCKRKVRNPQRGRFCSSLCASIAGDLVAAHHAVEVLGEYPTTIEYLESVEALDQAWARAQEARWVLRNQAIEAGWTVDEFSALLRTGKVPQSQQAAG